MFVWVCVYVLMWAACHSRFCQPKQNNSSSKYQCLFAFSFFSRKKTVNGFIVLFRFIFVKICLITVRGNETTCCVTLFYTVYPSHIRLFIHLSISLSFLPFSACSAFILDFNVCIAFKIAYELVVYFCYVRIKPKKTRMNERKKRDWRQTYKQRKHPHKWLACWQKQPFSSRWENKGPQL